MRFHLGALGELCVFMGLCLILLVGCGETAGRVSREVKSPISITPPSTSTPAATEVQLGTGLHQSGITFAIVNPTTSFTPSDDFAFVILLQSPIKASQVSCLIYDPQGNVLYSWTVSAIPGATMVASSTPPLGSIIPKDAPPGIYQLAAFSGSSSLINYGSEGNFTYSG
jgi:hypothetical protein